jgi:WD40 repeat protein
MVSKRFLPQFPQTISIAAGSMTQWPDIENSFEGHEDTISSVVISQDGKSIVSGSHDLTIRVWNADTGEVTMVFSGIFEEPAGYINSVAISQDCTRIVSGSSNMVHVLHVQTGDVISGPLLHTDRVNAVSISQDGTRIVSGCLDKTIRIWDANLGEVISSAFEGHTGPITSRFRQIVRLLSQLLMTSRSGSGMQRQLGLS